MMAASDPYPNAGQPMVDHALWYARHGWPVVPVYGLVEWADGLPCRCRSRAECPTPGKHPTLKGWPSKASTDLDVIARLWWIDPNVNIGIATGARSGIFVLDIDPEHGGDDSLDALIDEHGGLPDTVEVETGGGGRHIYFAYTDVGVIRNSVSELGPGLDIRSDHGYVVAPPSMHASGQRYEWELSSHPEEMPLAPPPTWLVNALRQTANGFPRSDSNGETKGGVDSTVALAGFQKGGRDIGIYGLACSLRARNVPWSEAVVLVLHSAAACSPPFPAAQAMAKLASAWKFPPGTGPADEETSSKQLVVLRSVANWFKDPPEPVEPMVTDLLLPSDQLVLGGARGAAKTWWLMGTALQLARGEGLVLGRFPVARRVKLLYCHGELPDDHSTFVRWERLIAGGEIPDTLLETYSRIRIRIGREKEPFYNETTGRHGTRERVSAVIDEAFVDELRESRPDVVALDPWAVFYTGQEIDNTQIEAAVAELSALTDELGITWIITHHFSQARQGADPEDWWRGATRLADWASVRITLQPAYNKSQIVAQGMTRIEARRFANVRLLLRRQETPPDFGARFDPATGFWVAWNSPTLTDQRRSGLTVDDVVKALWADGGQWTSTNKAKAALGVSHAKATQLLEEVKRAGLITAVAGRRGATVWTLKDLS
jgi:hypothetical protein